MYTRLVEELFNRAGSFYNYSQHSWPQKKLLLRTCQKMNLVLSMRFLLAVKLASRMFGKFQKRVTGEIVGVNFFAKSRDY